MIKFPKKLLAVHPKIENDEKEKEKKQKVSEGLSVYLLSLLPEVKTLSSLVAINLLTVK